MGSGNAHHCREAFPIECGIAETGGDLSAEHALREKSVKRRLFSRGSRQKRDYWERFASGEVGARCPESSAAARPTGNRARVREILEIRCRVGKLSEAISCKSGIPI